ncbi:MAG: MauE/DoxX family redox-associated membrane protein [Desulfosudaceae bacterium]
MTLKQTIKTFFGHWLTRRLLGLVLGGVFVYASLHKIAAPEQFARILHGYDLLPAALISPLAVFLPFFELVCGLALIFNICPRGGVLLIDLMLLVFIIAIAVNLIRGHSFDCGCFTFAHDPTVSAVQLLVRDLVGLAAGIHLLISGPGSFRRPAF